MKSGADPEFLVTGDRERQRARRAQASSFERSEKFFSWGSGGRCKPPRGVRGAAPENLAIFAYNSPILVHFRAILETNEEGRKEGRDCKIHPPHKITFQNEWA